MIKVLALLALVAISSVNCQASRDKIISTVIQNAIFCKNQPAATGCFLDQKTLNSMADAFATAVCNTKSIAEAGKELMPIVMKYVPLGPKAQVMAAYTGINNCLEKCGSNITLICNKATTVVSGTFGSVYNSVKAAIAKVVAAGLKCGSPQCLTATYDEFAKYCTPAYIKKLYDLLVQKASCGEVQCGFTNCKTMAYTNIAVSRMNAEKKCAIK